MINVFKKICSIIVTASVISSSIPIASANDNLSIRQFSDQLIQSDALANIAKTYVIARVELKKRQGDRSELLIGDFPAHSISQYRVAPEQLLKESDSRYILLIKVNGLPYKITITLNGLNVDIEVAAAKNTIQPFPSLPGTLSEKIQEMEKKSTSLATNKKYRYSDLDLYEYSSFFSTLLRHYFNEGIFNSIRDVVDFIKIISDEGDGALINLISGEHNMLSMGTQYDRQTGRPTD